ncbi:unnamed protein product [Cylindrotheca closterium]|uniref:Uncharacterized protein n=1 Tax=Cylindrotheca closterium TaxID=2856 RepID=A0AAD2FF96_9STRA|nr:unnamed protein product [Cylindrotheca closterium]
MICETYIKEALCNDIDRTAFSPLTFDSKNWLLRTCTSDDGTKLYQAFCFCTTYVPDPNLVGRGEIPQWITNQQKRPSSLEDALACLSPQVPKPAVTVIPLNSGNPALMFESIEVAVHMEAAFWLEWQLCIGDNSGIRHWYQFSLPEMLDALANRNDSESEFNILHC